MQKCSLYLGFYLASWGMYRGSGGLLQKNYLVHDGAVKILLSKEYRSLKCNSNQDVRKNSINLIMQLKEHLSKHYGEIIFRKGEREKPISCTDTLLSKVILGTLGCMPAYDRYFTTGLKAKGITSLLFGKDSLSELFHFIDENNQQIAQCQTAIKEKTGIYYPVMKIVDMYFWQIGFDNSLNLK